MSASPDTRLIDAAAAERRLLRERLARKEAEAQLETRSRELYLAQQQLEHAFSSTVETFASLLSGRQGRSRQSMRRLARHVRRLALAVGIAESELQHLHLAATLCDLGKLALSDLVLNTPVFEMEKATFESFRQHPRLAYEALAVLEPLEAVAHIILEHAEFFDGSGYPEGKTWAQTSLASQVLCTVKDFDALTAGIVLPEALTQADALAYMREQSGKRYSEEMVETWSLVLDEHPFDESTSVTAEQRVTPGKLSEGMVLTRDLTNDDGVLILGAGKTLNDRMIERLQRLQQLGSSESVLYVQVIVEASDEAAP